MDLVVADYARTLNEDPVRAEILRFRTDLGALGAWGGNVEWTERPIEFPGRVREGRRAFHAWSGSLYVRVVPPPHDDQREAAVALVGAIGRAIGPEPPLPDAFSVFPETGRVPESEAFTTNEGFGLPSFRPACLVQYETTEGAVAGLLFETSTEEEARAAFESWKDLFEANGRLLDPVETLPDVNFTAEDDYIGRTAALVRGKRVVAFRGSVSRSIVVEHLEQASRNLDEVAALH